MNFLFSMVLAMQTFIFDKYDSEAALQEQVVVLAENETEKAIYMAEIIEYWISLLGE